MHDSPLIKGWEKFPNKVGVADLKKNYISGDLGFDPLGLKPVDKEGFDLVRLKELQNGRLAMIGIAGVVAQELVTQKPIFEVIN